MEDRPKANLVTATVSNLTVFYKIWDAWPSTLEEFLQTHGGKPWCPGSYQTARLWLQKRDGDAGADADTVKGTNAVYSVEDTLYFKQKLENFRPRILEAGITLDTPAIDALISTVLLLMSQGFGELVHDIYPELRDDKQAPTAADSIFSIIRDLRPTAHELTALAVETCETPLPGSWRSVHATSRTDTEAILPQDSPSENGNSEAFKAQADPTARSAAIDALLQKMEEIPLDGLDESQELPSSIADPTTNQDVEGNPATPPRSAKIDLLLRLMDEQLRGVGQ